MVTIILDIAENGVVKTLEDDNINGNGELYAQKLLYSFDNDKDFSNRIKFIKDLCLEIGLELGNSEDAKRLNINVVSKAKKVDQLTSAELKTRINAAEKLLVEYKKQLEKYEIKS
jgi:hypothetical protein